MQSSNTQKDLNLQSSSQEEEIMEFVDEYSLEDLLDFQNDLQEINIDKLKRTTYATVAHFLDRLDIEEQRWLLRLLDEESASKIIAELDREDSALLIAAMRQQRAVAVLEELPPDDAAYVVEDLDEEDRNRLLIGLEEVSPKSAGAVRELLSYKKHTAGSMMTTEVAVVYSYMSINVAIEHIRTTTKNLEHTYYIYVVTSQDSLTLEGVLSMRDLVLARSWQRITDIMRTDLKGVLRVDIDNEKVASIMADLNLHTLPVVDIKGKLLGIVTHDDVIDFVKDEATEDMLKLAGVWGNESLLDGINKNFRLRVPSLAINLITSFIASLIIIFHLKDIASLTILAAFLPLITSISAAATRQSLAVAIRSISLSEVNSSESLIICVKETFKGFLNSLIIAFIAFLLVYSLLPLIDKTIEPNIVFNLSSITSLSIILALSLSAMASCSLAFVFKALKIDPANYSCAIMSLISKTFGFFIFLTLAKFIVL